MILQHLLHLYLLIHCIILSIRLRITHVLLLLMLEVLSSIPLTLPLSLIAFLHQVILVTHIFLGFKEISDPLLKHLVELINYLGLILPLTCLLWDKLLIVLPENFHENRLFIHGFIILDKWPLIVLWALIVLFLILQRGTHWRHVECFRLVVILLASTWYYLLLHHWVIRVKTVLESVKKKKEVF